MRTSSLDLFSTAPLSAYTAAMPSTPRRHGPRCCKASWVLPNRRVHSVVSTTRYFLILPLMAAIAYMAVVGLLCISQRTLLFPGAGATPAPEHASWGESVHVKTPDGKMLQGLYSQGDSDKSCVLLFFGNGDRVDNYAFLAQALAARRIGLLTISYRDYPGSTGSPSERGLLTDGIAAFDWLSAHARSEIVVLGRSLGTGVAVNTAGERSAAGVIVVSPHLSALSVAPEALSVPPGPASSQGSLSLGSQHRHGKTTEVVPAWPT